MGVVRSGLSELPSTSLAEAREATERLRSIVPHGQSVSAGLAHYQPPETAEQLLQRADEALYSAKRSGRDRLVVHDPHTAPLPESTAP